MTSHGPFCTRIRTPATRWRAARRWLCSIVSRATTSWRKTVAERGCSRWGSPRCADPRIEHLNRQLREREAQSLRRTLRVATSPCAPHQRVVHNDAERTMLAFCSNDYLGLACHPALADALSEGAALWGAGSGASHLISGH